MQKTVTGLAAATLLAAAFLAASPHSALADDAYDKCIEESDGSNASWGQCGSAYIQRADDALNATWKKVYPETEGQTKADLLAEQRAWVAFREVACAFYANGDYGREGQVLSYPVCVASIIEQRTETLESYGAEFMPQ